MNELVKLAKIICNYSLNLKAEEKVWLEYKGTFVTPFIKVLVKEILNKKANIYLKHIDDQILSEFLSHANQKQITYYSELDYRIMKMSDAYISVRGFDNLYEFSKVPFKNKEIYNKAYSKVTDYRVDKTRWVALRYPSNAFAQLAGMDTDTFNEFYFKVSNLDYKKLSSAMDKLVQVMKKTKIVRITGPNTDISFSIKNMPIIKCDGKLNIPDGEVYTAPIINSVNGFITYNIASNYNGKLFNNIYFKVKDGKIIEASSSNTKLLNQILDTDLGARYFGEFALGLNPYINKAIQDTLFDEKIYGSFHLTPGRAYKDADNGNKSSIHWDIVSIQTKEYGGGSIYFDNKLLRKDGEFVEPSLRLLNKNNF